MAFLELTAAQIEWFREVHADHAREMAPLAAQALQLAGDQAARRADTEAQMGRLCKQSQRLEADFRGKLRSRLNVQQLARLGQLEQAFALLPIIESAQQAGLIENRISLPPVGLPQGSVEVAYSWRRVLAEPLPGCASTVVHREVSTEDDRPVRRHTPN